MAKPAAAAAMLRTVPSSVGVPENNRQALIALLNQRLADSTDLAHPGEVGALEREGHALHSGARIV